MPKRSAGIVAYRLNSTGPEVLLVHPGGPFYARKDLGVWSIPKGEYCDGENPIDVARREFNEETGNVIHSNNLIPLSPVRLKSGKEILAWAVAADFDECFIKSNEFEMEWPPRSGRMQSFPEVDRAAWLGLDEARNKLNPAQVPLINEIEKVLRENNKAT